MKTLFTCVLLLLHLLTLADDIVVTTTYTWDFADRTDKSWLVKPGDQFKISLKNLTTATSYTAIYQYKTSRVNPSGGLTGTISTSASNTTTTVGLSFSATFSIQEGEELAVTLRRDGVGKDTVYTLRFLPAPNRLTLVDNDLPDTIYIDLSNARPKRFREKNPGPLPVDFMKRLILRPVLNDHRFFVNPFQVVHIGFSNLPESTTLHQNGKPVSVEAITSVKLNPGTSMLFTVLSQPYPFTLNQDGSASNPLNFTTVDYVHYLITAVNPKQPIIKIAQLDFVGDAILQNSISSPLKNPTLPANFGLGAIYTRQNDRLWFNRLIVETFFNFANTLDTVFVGKGPNYTNQIRDIGTSLLLPNTARQTFTLNSRFYLRNTHLERGFYGIERFLGGLSTMISGFHLRVTAANRVWVSDLPALPVSSTSISTTTVGSPPVSTPVASQTGAAFKIGAAAVKLGIFREFLPQDWVKDGYSLLVGGNYAYHGITGDLRINKNGRKESTKDDYVYRFQTDVIHNEAVRFGGLDTYVLLQLKNIRAGINYTKLWPIERSFLGIPIGIDRNSRWPGLTDGQFSFTISFVGGFPAFKNE